MGSDVIVINTGPLILLDKIGALEIAGQLPCSFICPPAVRAELDAGVVKGGAAIEPHWLTIKPLVSPLSPLVDVSLDRGEAEVIQLALDNNISRVCIDDLRGRRIAKVMGLRVTGLLGILAWAKRLGLIARLKPYSDKLLRGGGYYSQTLIRGILKEMGEEP